MFVAYPYSLPKDDYRRPFTDLAKALAGMRAWRMLSPGATIPAREPRAPLLRTRRRPRPSFDTQQACGVKKLDRLSDLAVRKSATPPSDSPDALVQSAAGFCAGCSAWSSDAVSTSSISRTPCSATS
jgi:hypothetical protein